MEKTLTVLQRVENHDKLLKVLQDNADNVLSSFRSSMTTAMETVEGIVLAMGEGFEVKVQEAITKKKQERAVERAAKEKEQVEQLVSQGVLKPIDTITDKSFIVGRVFDKDGNVVGAGRNQVEIANLQPAELQAKFVGQSVGFVYETDNHEKFEVLEAYEVLPPKATDAAPTAPEAVVADPTAPMVDAALTAPATTPAS